MKKTFLTTLLAFAGLSSYAQTTVTDTVSMGATAAGVSYPNQVWYSLENGVQGSRSRTDWDLAFDLKGFISGVRINSTAGVQLWSYPKGNLTNSWASVDTAGLSTWTARNNSDTSWAEGAIGRYADPNNAYSLDWGTYNMTTHIVTGDSIFIVKLASGQYKKFAIESLTSGVYSFKYANLDGTDAKSQTLTKTNYPDKNFAYLNLGNQTLLDREPAASKWDLVFTQYTTFIPIPYGVTGVLQNRNTAVAKVSNLPDVATNVDYSSRTFSTEINTIGYNWKSFTGSTYAVKDSQLYFLRRPNGDVWKLIFKGFGGAANGNFIFSKQKIYAAPSGIKGIAQSAALAMTLAPNPAVSNTTLHCNFGAQSTTAQLLIFDVTGRSIFVQDLVRAAGEQQYPLPIATLPKGQYVVMVHTTEGNAIQKLIVQ